MSALTTTGKSTFGAPIDERYARVGNKVRWKSKADAAEREVSGPAAYVAIENSPEFIAILARAVLKAPRQQLPALPSGQLLIEKLTEAKVVAKASGTPGKGAAKPREGTASLYALRGLGIAPTYVWLWNGAANKQRMLGFVEPAFAFLETGWENNHEALLKVQVAADAKSHKALYDKLALRRDHPIVIRNVKWFDANNATLNGPSDVHINDGRIAAIFPPNAPIEGEATAVDGSGRFLSPGLFDMHVHTGPWDALLHLAGGVTTVRDMGNDNAFLATLKARIDRGDAIGPNIVATGYIEGKSPYSSYGGFVVEDVEGAKKAIDWYAQRGFRQVKLYNSIKPEWVEPVAAHAHARGIRVSGHIPAFMRAEEAVRAGFDEIQHINQLVLNFLTKKDDDTRTLLRFYLVGDNANQIDLEGDKVRDFIKLLVDRKVAVDPTMTTFEAMYNQRQGAPNPSFRMVSPNMPPSISRAWLTNSMDVNDKNAEPFRKSYEKLLGFVKKMYDAGVPVLAGSDDVAGFTMHRELELYVMAGLTPAQALQIATRNGARYSMVESRTGTIEVGKDADLVLMEEDPTKNVGAARKIALTVKRGVAFENAALYEALGVKPFTQKLTISHQPAPTKGEEVKK
ncbi:MAG: amidohydrolase family protein [Betaproteobacteria bacterium]|nr:amidohydrolase family protein [Betaproteobacteria bacterium]